MMAVFSERAERDLERIFQLRRRAIELLDIINAEFRSDPTSLQCFDSRIVSEVDSVLRELKRLDWMTK